MRIGDIIICISETSREYLTYGKQYEIKGIYNELLIVILNDRDKMNYLSPRRFVSLSRWREMRLLELGIK